MKSSPDSYTDEQGNFWTMEGLLANLDRGEYLYLTPKMCADLAKHLRQCGPLDETWNDAIRAAAAAVVDDYYEPVGSSTQRDAILQLIRLSSATVESK